MVRWRTDGLRGAVRLQRSPDLVVVFLVSSADSNTAVVVISFRLIVALSKVRRALSRARRSRGRWLLGLLLRLRLLLLRALHIRTRVRRRGRSELVVEVGVVRHLRCGVRSWVVVLLVFGERGGVLAEQLLAVPVVCIDHIDAWRSAGRCLS
jgi:hypothetical protein